MRTHVAVSVIPFVLAALFCLAAPVRADKALMSITFQKAGVAKGPKAIRGIECTRVTFAGDPSRAGHGSRMGGQNRTFTIVKEVDSSSPKLMRACTQALPFNGRIVYTQANGAGMTSAAGTGEEKPYLTVILTNAVIQKIGDAPKSARGKSQEQVTITYQKIEFTQTKGGKTFQDDWEAPV